MTRRSHSTRAFTLVELIATLTVISVGSAVAASVISTAARSYSDSAQSASLHTQASSALERITRELKACPTDDASPTPAPLITSVQRSSIDWGAGYRLALVSRTLNLTTPTQSAQPIAENVASFTIRAFDHLNNPLPANLNSVGARDVRRIEITITLASGAASETLRARVAPRSLTIAQP
ncbi:MAG: type II secretion system protein J [Phycisphaerales bacterium]